MIISRRNFLRLCAAAGLMAGQSQTLFGAQKKTAARPNIVLIMADDLGYECIEANGGTSYKTPHLNRLAAEGMRFEHCYAQPVCTPSRLQMMTGIYNIRYYVDFGILPPNLTMFAQLLRKSGYATSIAGKWQLGMDRESIRPSGFDEHCLWSLEAEEKTPRYNRPSGFIQNGKELSEGTKYGPDIMSDFVLDFITRNKTRPFLCYYPMLLPHAPYEPTPDSPARENTNKPDRDLLSRVMQLFHRDRVKKTYYFPDMVAYMDKLVGKVVAHLDNLGLRENTLILFTGDNGTSPNIRSMLGNKEITGAKGKTTDAGTHVPLIASWPQVIRKARVSSDLVDFTDFMPTLCEAANIPLPTDLTIDGRSFLPQLRGDKGRPRQWIYCWHSANGTDRRAVEFARNQRYKLYRTGEFYDISQDDLEKRPLPDSSLDASAKETKVVLQSVLNKFRDARPAHLRKA